MAFSHARQSSRSPPPPDDARESNLIKRYESALNAKHRASSPMVMPWSFRPICANESGKTELASKRCSAYEFGKVSFGLGKNAGLLGSGEMWTLKTKACPSEVDMFIKGATIEARSDSLQSVGCPSVMLTMTGGKESG